MSLRIIFVILITILYIIKGAGIAVTRSPPHVYTTRETPSGERRNSMGEKCLVILPKCQLPRYI
jgi:hypothetical protein